MRHPKSPKHLKPLHKQLDPDDGGYASRKFWFAVGTSAAIAIAGLGCAHWPTLAGIYPTYIGGVMAVYAAYCGANVGAKFIVGNHIAKIGTGTAAEESVAPDPVDLAALQRLPEQPQEQLPPDHDQPEAA